MNFKSEQEKFWAGDFGNTYINRNSEIEDVSNRTALFSQIINKTKGISSVLELGANIGNNLMALRNILPSCEIGAVEINKQAFAMLNNRLPNAKTLNGSIFDFSPEEIGNYDFTFTSGVLIHINPDLLTQVYERLYACSKKYILICEYYNPSPVEVSYRGHSERLFKRDFAGEMLDLYPSLELKDYGFFYHRDNNFPADDLNWFLLKKN